MFCKRCGAQLPDDARFCPGCGLDLKSISRPPVRQDTPKAPDTPRQEAPKARKFSAPKFHKKPAAQAARPGRKLSVKWLLLPVLVIAVGFASVRFLQNRKVGEIPDPSVFFGREPSSRVESSAFLYRTYKFDPDEDPTAMMESFAGLLNSQSFPFRMTDSSDSGGYREYTFQYTGPKSLTLGWEEDGRDLKLSCRQDNDGTSSVNLTSYSYNHFTLAAQIPSYGSAAAGSSASDGAPGTTEPDVTPAEPDATPAEPDATPAEPDVTPAGTDPVPVERVPPVDLSGPVVPDLMSFGNNALLLMRDDVNMDHSHKSYAMRANAKFILEYVDLLKTYGFTLKETAEKRGMHYYYAFDYTGPGTAGTFTPGTSDLKGGPVALYIWYFSGYEVHLYYGDGITCADTGDRTTQTLTPYEGSPGSGDGSSSSDSESSSSWNQGTKIKCTKCHGEKEIDCTQCDGRGTLAGYGSTPNYSGKQGTSYSDRQTCSKCKGSGRIECTRCGGTGWQ